MQKSKLKGLRKDLEELLLSPHNVSSNELERIARKVGRKLVKRGKEPNYIRLNDPSLSPPLSIPNRQTLKAGTAKSIINALISDVDEWEIYLSVNENEK